MQTRQLHKFINDVQSLHPKNHIKWRSKRQTVNKRNEEVYQNMIDDLAALLWSGQFVALDQP